MGSWGARHLLLYRDWHWTEDEGGDIRQVLAGALASVDGDDGRILASDGRRTYDVRLEPGSEDRSELLFRRREPLLSTLLRRRVDVVFVFLPLFLHLLVAVVARMRGIPVVVAPMSWFGDDFAASTWFRDPSPIRSRLKPWMVRTLRTLWAPVATVYLVTSRHEARTSHLPPQRCAVAPLPAPDSPLSRAASGLQRSLAGDGPLALVSRFDVHRKGFDRVSRWLAQSSDRLPRPALRLLAPDDPNAPERFRVLTADGLIDWDPDPRGEELLPALDGCRGVILLTRYETHPRALREALLLGLPIITTQQSCFAEMIAALDAGVVIDGDDIDAIQAAFESLPDCAVPPPDARSLLDRTAIGSYLLRVGRQVAERRPLAPPSYFEWRGAGVD